MVGMAKNTSADRAAAMMHTPTPTKTPPGPAIVVAAGTVAVVAAATGAVVMAPPHAVTPEDVRRRRHRAACGLPTGRGLPCVRRHLGLFREMLFRAASASRCGKEHRVSEQTPAVPAA